jgi:uncharacterized protein
MPEMTPEKLIQRLGLAPHPGEGGFYRETYRAQCLIPADKLPAGYSGPRSAGTAIFYLLTHGTCSALHRLPGDELFHFYFGDPVEMLQLKGDGTGEVVTLGHDLDAGMAPQVLVPAGVWQGSRLQRGGRFALLGTTMSPGFEFADYEPGVREALLKTYPAHAERIVLLTQERD